jgi:hypothetical protein
MRLEVLSQQSLRQESDHLHAGCIFPEAWRFFIAIATGETEERMQRFQVHHSALIRIGFLFSLILFGSNNGVAQSVAITWNPNAESDIAGYKIYYGQVTRNYDYVLDVNRNTDYTISSLPDTGVYYFAVTAYDVAGNESNYSEEVTIHIRQPRFFYGLQQNFPNPFNPFTLIPYYLPRKMKFTLSVYDLTGRLVKTLDQGEKEAGKYLIKWDGKDQRNTSVATGTYVCRLVSEGFYQTRKLIVLH